MPSTLKLSGNLLPNLSALADSGPLLLAAGATLAQRAERIMAVSRRLAPVLDGVLRSSATALPPQYTGTQAEVVMGYGGAASRYALKVHENPRSGRTGGFSPSGKRYKRFATTGGWKFLEQAYLAEREGTLEALAESVRADFARRLAR